MTTISSTQSPWHNYAGPNLGYIHDQYELFLDDPASVDPAYRTLFEQWGEPPLEAEDAQAAPLAQREGVISFDQMEKLVAASKYVSNIRTYGHLAAKLDPLELAPKTEDDRMLKPENYKLTKLDLMGLPGELIWENAKGTKQTGLDAVEKLLEIYTGTTAYEFDHIHVQAEREWLTKNIEVAAKQTRLSREEQINLLDRLVQTEQFEHFLHRTFLGQKRFSVEGLEVLIPMLDELVRNHSESGASDILMGMAHRGRLNVLTHVLGKPYSKIFAEFQHGSNKEFMPPEDPSGKTGDVKYHLGAQRTITNSSGQQTRITLANNPSHLEYVNPVVEGFGRAAQEDRTQPGYPKRDEDKAAVVLMHGDSAFPGEGIVPETLNFDRLPGFRNGGTIHIIVNNRIGFTTESIDSRSTRYASDVAKGFDIPIVHVNGDDPEACIAAIRLACEYRKEFKKDFVIDLIGYRRYGHNEMDDPQPTQPLMYDKMRNHPSAPNVYSAALVGRGVIGEDVLPQLKQKIISKMEEAYEQVKNLKADKTAQAAPADVPGWIEPQTGVELEQLKDINERLLERPASFTPYSKLANILQRRSGALDEGKKVDWALAETLAFATILADGTPIRITGQDAERATFAHRNLVLHDSKTGALYCPLHHLPQARASFAIHNSPLSEAGVLGFEYGYNVFAPETMNIWEAQYGDFTNVAQVLIDQFISSAREKWSQKSSLVMLLPHSYEGQGPEHSSARPERFLQQSAQGNWTVANLTSAAQYFHLLRRQAKIVGTEQARPLIVMAPKSLIRHPRVASTGTELSDGKFHTVLEQPGLGGTPDKVQRVILCTGKVAIDLDDAIANAGDQDFSWLHIIRVEQLYPFPKEEIESILSRYGKVKEIVWVQEEPENMGAWRYIQPHLQKLAPKKIEVDYIGRPERSSPATGYNTVHAHEQQQIISAALKLKQDN
ncbi:2-oxoglutarate dehydrogenase E1 component [Paenibacillus sp. SYP-B4298]|uniref:2-oxoglutarate dehydrogenase E1 component n=1 Tax=Paenibacillus sp. SYP-B4298 TaxID=2996034 RepID=UPI0022DD6C87|nr:2-oxoglutarate dehydrogenase E1 component [Paenibacillus sp. SYP-B4298]